MKIVVMGTGPFAIPTCKMLLTEGHKISLVVTRPLAGKSKKPPPRPVFEWAAGADLPIFEPDSINTESAVKRLQEESADLFFVCDYGQILSKECLSASRLGGINLHGSLLPRHRGAAPVQWALLRGDQATGVTVIHMSPRLDAGPALAVAKTQVLPDETAGELEPRLAELGVDCTSKAIAMLAAWDGNSQIGDVQDKASVTKAPRFDKKHGQLDFRLPTQYLVQLVRACQPWPGTYAELCWSSGKQMRIIVRKARAVRTPESLVNQEIGSAHRISANDLNQELLKTENWQDPWDEMIAVTRQSEMIVLGCVQPAGKREMSCKEFLRGHPLDEGCHFRLPEPQVQELYNFSLGPD